MVGDGGGKGGGWRGRRSGGGGQETAGEGQGRRAPGGGGAAGGGGGGGGGRPGGGGVMVTGARVLATACSYCSASSRAWAGRWAGSLARQAWTTCSMACGTCGPAPRAANEGGSSV